MQPEQQKKHGFPYETPYEEKRRLRAERGEPEPVHAADIRGGAFPPVGTVVRSFEPMVTLTPAEQRQQHQLMTTVYREEPAGNGVRM
jgi:hypothetical protein